MPYPMTSHLTGFGGSVTQETLTHGKVTKDRQLTAVPVMSLTVTNLCRKGQCLTNKALT